MLFLLTKKILSNSNIVFFGKDILLFQRPSIVVAK